MRVPRWPFLLLAASGWLTLWALSTDSGSALRIIMSVGFLVLCPGAAIVALVRPLLGRRDHAGDAMESVALAVAISIGLGMLVSELYFMTGTFSLPGTVSVLAGITTTASLGALGMLMRRSHRRARAASAAKAPARPAPAPAPQSIPSPKPESGPESTTASDPTAEPAGGDGAARA